MRRLHRSRGQALVMVSIALIAMFAIIGLAIDLGWSFFVHKNARDAADAAALAAAKKAFVSHPWASGTPCAGSNCLTTGWTSCAGGALDGTNLMNGCLYAVDTHRGFTLGQVRMAAGTGPLVTETGTVNVQYWARAVVVQEVPQLFSAVMGHTKATVSALATAGIFQTQVIASFIILDRTNDPSFGTKNSGPGDWTYGANLVVTGAFQAGTESVLVDGTILMASECRGTSLGAQNCVDGGPGKAVYAGTITNQGIVKAKGDIKIAGVGEVDPAKGTWEPDPQSGAPPVLDPLAGRGQPPVPAGGLNIPIKEDNGGKAWIQPGATDFAGNVVCPQVGAEGHCIPGRYYAVNASGLPTGNPLHFAQSVTLGSANTFSDFVFWGGIAGKTNATVTFGPGRYVFAGASAAASSVIDTTNYFTMKDFGAAGGEDPTYPGELLIFTDASYNGALTNLPVGLKPLLDFGRVEIQAGQAGGGGGGGGGKTNYITLHGLNPDLVTDPDLAAFIDKGTDFQKSLLFWWDQRNSLAKYYGLGADSYPCGSAAQTNDGGGGCVNTTLTNPNSPELYIHASPDVHLYGIIYQPRGAWTVFDASGNYSGALQIITGAFRIQGSPHLTLGVPTDPALINVVALIQ